MLVYWRVYHLPIRPSNEKVPSKQVVFGPWLITRGCPGWSLLGPIFWGCILHPPTQLYHIYMHIIIHMCIIPLYPGKLWKITSNSNIGKKNIVLRILEITMMVMASWLGRLSPICGINLHHLMKYPGKWHFWLVVDLPLWKIWVRQLELLFPIYGEKMFQSTNQHFVSRYISWCPFLRLVNVVEHHPTRYMFKWYSNSPKQDVYQALILSQHIPLSNNCHPIWTHVIPYFQHVPIISHWFSL